MFTKLNTVRGKQTKIHFFCDFQYFYTLLEAQNFSYRIRSGRKINLKDGKKGAKVEQHNFPVPAPNPTEAELLLT